MVYYTRYSVCLIQFCLFQIILNVYINDFYDNITNNVLKCADYTEVFRKVNTDGDKQHLQNYLDKLNEKWDMLINVDKCKGLHTGYGNMLINVKAYTQDTETC